MAANLPWGIESKLTFGTELIRKYEFEVENKYQYQKWDVTWEFFRPIIINNEIRFVPKFKWFNESTNEEDNKHSTTI